MFFLQVMSELTSVAASAGEHQEQAVLLSKHGELEEVVVVCVAVDLSCQATQVLMLKNVLQ